MKNFTTPALILITSFMSFQAAQAEDCSHLLDNTQRLACYDQNAKKTNQHNKTVKKAKQEKTVEPILSSSAKSCVLASGQKLTRIMRDATISKSRASPRSPSPVAGTEAFDVELDARTSGIDTTYVFLCVTGGPQNITVAQPLGHR